MFKKKKKDTEPQEQQWYRSATGIDTYNYKIYTMKLYEKIVYFMIGFVLGAFVGYLFYGGLAKNELGMPTAATFFLNTLISGTFGIIAGLAYVPMRRKQLVAKQQRNIRLQFRDYLEAFTTSLGAGKNVVDSFVAVRDDMRVQYDENAYIVKELDVIISGINHNVDIEELLADFGERSGLDDIKSFANVFKICYRKGGNIKETVKSTHAILSDKMSIAEEIETVITSNKLEQNIMIVMPIVLIGVIKGMSPDFAENFTNTTGIAATTIALVMFVAAYLIGKSILNIKM